MILLPICLFMIASHLSRIHLSIRSVFLNEVGMKVVTKVAMNVEVCSGIASVPFPFPMVMVVGFRNHHESSCVLGSSANRIPTSESKRFVIVGVLKTTV